MRPTKETRNNIGLIGF